MKKAALLALLLFAGRSCAEEHEGADPSNGGGDGGDGDGGGEAEAVEELEDAGDIEYDYDYEPVTKEDRKEQCVEKLDIINQLFMDNTSGNFDDEDVKTIRAANGDGYPDNSLGYVWCSRFNGGLQRARDDTANNIEMTIAPYLPIEKLPMTVAAVDELGGNQLESVALKAVTDQYNPEDFKTMDAFKDMNKAQKEATYEWSGAASLEGQAPSLGDGDVAPQKTSLSRIMSHPNNADDQNIFMCACGVYTSDMSAETGKGINEGQGGGDGGDGGDGGEGGGEDGGEGGGESDGGDEGGDGGGEAAPARKLLRAM